VLELGEDEGGADDLGELVTCSRQVSARLPAGVHRLRRSRVSSRVTRRSSSIGTPGVARQVITSSPRAEDDLRQDLSCQDSPAISGHARRVRESPRNHTTARLMRG
jgi:hypothetical protein